MNFNVGIISRTADSSVEDDPHHKPAVKFGFSGPRKSRYIMGLLFSLCV